MPKELFILPARAHRVSRMSALRRADAGGARLPAPLKVLAGLILLAALALPAFLSYRLRPPGAGPRLRPSAHSRAARLERELNAQQELLRRAIQLGRLREEEVHALSAALDRLRGELAADWVADGARLSSRSFLHLRTEAAASRQAIRHALQGNIPLESRQGNR